MNITDELERLDKLHKDGALSDEEFAQAKDNLLNRHEESLTDEFKDNSLGEAANRYVTFQIVMGVIGLIIFLIFFFSIILPHFNSGPSFHIAPQFP